MENEPVEDGEESGKRSGREGEDEKEGGFGGLLAGCGEGGREVRVLVNTELGFRSLGTALRGSSFHHRCYCCPLIFFFFLDS